MIIIQIVDLRTTKKIFLTTTRGNYSNSTGINVTLDIDDKLVYTVIQINEGDNVTSYHFQKIMEARLADIYNDALNLINTKRVKRFSSYQNASIQITNISSGYDNDMTQLMMIYFLIESSNFPNITLAKRTVSLMTSIVDKYTIQYVTLKLGYVVLIPAETYLSDPVPPENNKWIVGVIIGTILIIFFLIWAIAFIYVKCTQPKKLSVYSQRNLKRNIIFIEKKSDEIKEVNHIEIQTDLMNDMLYLKPVTESFSNVQYDQKKNKSKKKIKNKKKNDYSAESEKELATLYELPVNGNNNSGETRESLKSIVPKSFESDHDNQNLFEDEKEYPQIQTDKKKKHEPMNLCRIENGERLMNDSINCANQANNIIMNHDHLYSLSSTQEKFKKDKSDSQEFVQQNAQHSINSDINYLKKNSKILSNTLVALKAAGLLEDEAYTRVHFTNKTFSQDYL